MVNNSNNPSEENFSFDKSKKNPFAMPEDYFNSFEDRLKHKMEFEEELKEFPALISVSKQSVFYVPKNYFTVLENNLQKQYELQAYPTIHKIAKPELEQITSDYFETSKNKILQSIEISEELAAYKTLQAFEKQNNFSVDPLYFETVAERVKETYHSSTKEKRSIFQNALDYILKPKVAFVYSIVIGISLFYYFNKPNTVESGDCKTLACLEKRELLNEKNENEFSDEDLYEMIDIEQLDEKLIEVHKDSDSVNEKITTEQ